METKNVIAKVRGVCGIIADIAAIIAIFGEAIDLINTRLDERKTKTNEETQNK